MGVKTGCEIAYHYVIMYIIMPIYAMHRVNWHDYVHNDTISSRTISGPMKS